MVYPHLYRTEHSETKTTNSSYGEYFAQHQSVKIAIQPELLKILQYIDTNRSNFLDDLKEAVEIQSISANLQYRNEVKRMIKFIENWLNKLGIKYECFNIGFHEIAGKNVRLPTVILASLGRDCKKKTICVYAHLDVTEPNPDIWLTDPWKVTDIDGHFHGSGIASGKGVLLAWFHVIQAFQSFEMELPVNLKFIIESMYFCENQGLAEFLATRKQDFLYNINNVVVCDSEWLGEKKPCLIYGTVGKMVYELIVEKAPKSHSEPKEDIEKILGNLVDEQGKILTPGFYDYVKQITPEEEKIYEQIQDFDIDEVRKSLPEYKKTWDQVKLLMHFWRLPAICIGDNLECSCDKNDKTTIKRLFIIKTVPKQSVQRSSSLTISFIEKLSKILKIPNKINCKLLTTQSYWIESVDSPHYEAARRATIQIYKEEPNLIREDNVRLIVTILDRILEKPILLLPLATSGSNVGGQNENVSRRNFYEGRKLLAAYLFQMALIK